jgi:hypothetical protein
LGAFKKGSVAGIRSMLPEKHFGTQQEKKSDAATMVTEFFPVGNGLTA